MSQVKSHPILALLPQSFREEVDDPKTLMLLRDDGGGVMKDTPESREEIFRNAAPEV